MNIKCESPSQGIGPCSVGVGWVLKLLFYELQGEGSSINTMKSCQLRPPELEQFSGEIQG